MDTDRRGLSPDIYAACFSDVNGWGGGLTAARGVVRAGLDHGLRTLLLGVSSSGVDLRRSRPQQSVVNLRIRTRGGLWRVRNWRLAGQLEAQLRRLPPPTRGFVGVSPYWVVAAKRAWPKTPVTYLFPCLLSNCLPFTWPKRRPSGLWQRINFAGIRHAEHLAFSLADLTLTPTELARREVVAFHPAASPRLAVCPYGSQPREVDPHLRSAQRQRLALDRAVVFLAAGVCDLNKAFDLAIRELTSVDSSAHVVIVGDGPERNRLRRLAADCGVSARVHLVGAHPDMEPWYAAADCIISTSFYDTFPNAVLEGMSHGHPALVPQHAPPLVYSGPAEVIEQAGGGLLYDRNQPGSLAQCMNQLVRSPELLRTLGQQARRIAQHQFRWDRVLERILNWTDQPARTAVRSATMATAIPSHPAVT